MKKLSKIIASFGLLTAKMSANTACVIWWHQPKMPEGIKKLRRF